MPSPQFDANNVKIVLVLCNDVCQCHSLYSTFNCIPVEYLKTWKHNELFLDEPSCECEIFKLFFTWNTIIVRYKKSIKLFVLIVCPRRVQCDPGTENPILGKCQMFLRRSHTDSLAGPKSFFQSASVINQVRSVYQQNM